MLTIYVINLKTKTVVYHGTLEQCNSILKKYSQRRYFLAILNTIPSTYVHTYELWYDQRDRSNDLFHASVAQQDRARAF